MSATIGSISPVPTDAEAAAIAAAVTLLWPEPAPVVSLDRPATNTRWRFSGRPWASNLVLRRVRPVL